MTQQEFEKIYGTILLYENLNKPQKLQVIKFIRKFYNGVNIRDIISGEYKALLKDDKLRGVITEI